MSTNRTATRSIIVLIILGVSFLIAGCGGDGDGTVKTADGIADTIDSAIKPTIPAINMVITGWIMAINDFVLS